MSGSDVRVGLAVPAAGEGRRMGGRRKPWLTLAGEPVLRRALRPFLDDARVRAVAVALGPGDAEAPPDWLRELDPRIRVVAGGASRAESVREAVAALPADLDVILVHDAARPLVPASAVDRCIRAAAAGRCAVVGWPATDTLKEVDGEGRVVDTPDRSRLWHAQTPQGFPADLFRDACGRLDEVADVAGRGAGITDDASLVEALGHTVHMVEGSPRNLKVTRPEDLPVAELFLRMEAERT